MAEDHTTGANMKLPNEEDAWIIEAIGTGEFDYCADALIVALRARQGPNPQGPPKNEPKKPRTRERKVWQFDIGDTVVFNDKIRPGYLQGLTATVVKRNRVTVTIACPDHPNYGRFQGMKNVRFPIEAVDAA